MASVAYQRQLCGEIFTSHNYLMMLECKFCLEQFTAYDKFLNHIFDTHFDNIDIKDDENESVDYDDLDIVNESEEVEDFMEQEYVDHLAKVSTYAGDKDENSLSADIRLPGDAKEYECTTKENNVLKNLSKCSSKKDHEGETAQLASKVENRQQDPATDTLSTIYRPVVTKYRPKRGGADRKYKCKFCGETFAQIHILRNHERRHSSNKPLGCTKCTKRFFTRTELATHLRWHTGERPFVCTYCGSGFITNGALNIHEKRHLNERNYKCDHCERRFYDGSQLREHAVVHTQERNYKCEECKATFTRIKSLRNHKKLHENALRYECNVCNMRFNQKPSLIWHEKSKHSIVRGRDSAASKALVKRRSNEPRGRDSAASKAMVKRRSNVPNQSPDQKFECKRCDLELEDKNSLLQHQRVIHADADALTTIEALEEAESEALIDPFSI